MTTVTNPIQNDPIYSLPYLYINGLNISVASTTVLAIAPGQARDSTNSIDMPVGQPNLLGVTNPGSFFPTSVNFGPIPGLTPSPQIAGFTGYPIYYPSQPLFINSGVVGANGLDAGTLAASSFYTVWLIGDSRNVNPVAGIMSLYSNAFPLLPSGYDSYRLLGFVGSDGSTHLVNTNLLNTKNSNAFYLQPPISVLAGGNSTTFAAIDCSSAIPADLFTIAQLTVNFTPLAAGDTVQFRPTTSSATAGLVTIVGLQAGVSQTDYVNTIVGITGGKAEIDYKVTSASDSVSVLVSGYILTLS
jgi:hypothetical protein